MTIDIEELERRAAAGELQPNDPALIELKQALLAAMGGVVEILDGVRDSLLAWWAAHPELRDIAEDLEKRNLLKEKGAD